MDWKVLGVFSNLNDSVIPGFSGSLGERSCACAGAAQPAPGSDGSVSHLGRAARGPRLRDRAEAQPSLRRVRGRVPRGSRPGVGSGRGCGMGIQGAA